MRDILLILVYAIATVAPFLVSTANLAKTIGVTTVLSLAITILVERDTLTSVWCFFAAILSAQIVVAVRREQRWKALPSDERLSPSRP